MDTKKFDYNKHPATMDTPILEAEAYRNSNGAFEVNYSSLLTRLIQEAGRWCRRYASDLFIDWEPIANGLKDGSIESGTSLFGFREDGVDHNTFVKSRYENESMYGSASHEYRALWRLDVNVEKNDYGDKVYMKLYEIQR